jgi:hypothetical protein
VRLRVSEFPVPLQESFKLVFNACYVQFFLKQLNKKSSISLLTTPASDSLLWPYAMYWIYI